MPDGVVFSSMLRSITASVGTATVHFELRNSKGGVLLAENYAAFDDKIAVYDLNVLIEQDMRNRNISFDTYEITVASVTHSLQVLYCDRTIDCEDIDDWLANNLLTTLRNRRIAADAEFEIYYFVPHGEIRGVFTYLIFRNRSTGDIQTLSPGDIIDVFDGRTRIESKAISVSGLIHSVARFNHLDEDDIEPLAICLRFGSNESLFFIAKGLEFANSFTFHNCFNLPEVVTLPTITTTKTEVERSVAMLNSRCEFYDRNVVKSHTEDVGPLTSEESDWIDQLIASHSVARFATDDTNTLLPVLITDATCEVSNGDEAPNSVKFTWRYADTLPVQRLGDSAAGIFNNCFNECFA